MVELAFNNSVTMGNGMSPFYANYGFHPAAVNPPDDKAGPLNPNVYIHWMETVSQESRKGLEVAQERMCRYTDPTWKEPPVY